MSMFKSGDILETIGMITQENLDVRTVTMGISLLDCIDPDPKKACEKIYNKITTKAADLVRVVEGISTDYGIPIINKRISVTPIAMLLGACGVSEDDITADYCVSQLYLGHIYIDMGRYYKDSGCYDPADPFFSTAPENMRFFLRHIRENYGSMSGYLTACGITEPTLERIRAKLVAKV